ncbi:C-terminal binding protein [Haloprofundus halobius]|uniref:C-terminal binding protein n=1 Tax=Haloprofundus halobius TaxID=2876194 RepID=UPI001CCB320E|nr:C-terminal binding protein [Haloprofundus halobius]
MSKTIVVTDWDFPDLSVEQSVVADTDVTLVSAQAETPSEVIDAAEGADGLLVQYAPVTEEVLEALGVDAVGRYGIGVDNVDVDAATARGVYVLNVPDYCLDEVPTHALSLLLACARRVAQYDHEVKSGTWDWTSGRPIDRVAGSTLGLVGFGKLPRRLVDLVSGFEFEVLVYDPYVDAEEIEAAGAEKVSFGALLERSRFVSVHAPLTDETRGLFDADAFERMRDDAVLVNTARGGLVDVDALVTAVDEGHIAGAGIDVLPEEPPEPTPPLDHPNIVYTPHVAWYSEQSSTEMRRRVTEDVLGVVTGDAPTNPVNDPSGD